MAYWADDRRLLIEQRRIEAAQDKAMFDSIVHGLRMQGWSRIEAEGEALERIERARQRRPQ